MTASTQTESRAASATERGADSPPRLVLVGREADAEEVRPALSNLQIDVEWRPDLDPPRVAESTAVAIVGLDEASRPVHDTKRLRATTDCPIFVITGASTSDAAARRLYAAGADAVFEWPTERRLIARFLAETLALRFVRGRAARPDTALARNVRAHLKLLPGLSTLPSVEVRDGLVRLSGQVERLRLAREIERAVMGIPGVRSLDLEELIVVPVRVPDARLRRAARRLLASSSHDLDASTLALNVEGGRLVVEGSLPSRAAARLLEERATGLLGLRAIEIRARISRSAQRADRGTARRLRDAIADLFPDADLRVSFFDGTAVLSGSVPSLRGRRELVEFVSDHPSVARVIDKTDVQD